MECFSHVGSFRKEAIHPHNLLQNTSFRVPCDISLTKNEESCTLTLLDKLMNKESQPAGISPRVKKTIYILFDVVHMCLDLKVPPLDTFKVASRVFLKGPSLLTMFMFTYY